MGDGETVRDGGEPVGRWMELVAVDPKIERLVCGADLQLSNSEDAKAFSRDLLDFLLSRERVVELDLRGLAQPNSALIGCIMRARMVAQQVSVKLVVLCDDRLADMLQIAKVDEKIEVRRVRPGSAGASASSG